MNISKSLCIIGVAVAISVASKAQSSASTYSQSAIRPSFIGLFVSQLDSTKLWYENKLGFKVMQYKKISPQLSFAMLEWNGIWIEMIQNPKVTQRKRLAESFAGAAGVDASLNWVFRLTISRLLKQGLKPMELNSNTQ